MSRIVGVDIQEHLRLEYALQAIYGIGKTNVLALLAKAKLDPNKRAKLLTDEEIAAIQKALEGFVYEGELRRRTAQNISRLKNINSYRGLRHKQNLPVHGQRTKSNARTKRGKRVTVGAFKKTDLSKTEQTKKS